tara:strand:- start:257 stop:1435 length:1179 start_codon:yes stop_codon:yes gene_type:complete
MVYTHDGPGDWRQFVLREDVKSLTTDEQRRKFLTEQYEFESFKNQQAYLQSNALSQLNNQYSHGGDINENKIISATLGGTLQSVSGFTAFIDVVFDKSVGIVGSGVPEISAPNNLVGNGLSSPLVYSYASGAYSNTLRFTATQAASATNAGAVSANVVSVGADIAASGAITSPTGTVNGTYIVSPGATPPDYVVSGGLGRLAVFSVLIASDSISTFTCTTAGNQFVPGTTITLNDGVTSGGLLQTGANLFDSITTLPSAPVNATYTGVALTSTGAGTAGTLDVTVAGGAVVTPVTVNAVGTGYTKGQVLTIAAGSLGAGSGAATITLLADDVQGLGGVVTLTADDFTGDVISLVTAPAIVPGSSVIFTVGGDNRVSAPLAYTSTSTNTAVAT